MRPTYRSVTGVGVSPPVVLDLHQEPLDVGLFVVISGTVSTTVEMTSDDIFAAGYSPAAGNWFAVTGLSAVAANTAVKLPIPCRAVRLNNATGSGTAQLQVIQAGG